MKFKNIKAVIFDIDGTLIDTTELILKCYNHTFKNYSISPKSKKEIFKVFGHPLKKCYEILCSTEDVVKLCEAHMNFQEKNLHLARNFKGILKTLKKLKEKKLKIAAISARSNRTTMKTIKKAGLTKYIDVLISREDIINPKPHPDPLFLALKKLKIDPKNAIMVGDTPVDIQAGKNAGTRTIGVTYGPLENSVKKENPDKVISSSPQIIDLIDR